MRWFKWAGVRRWVPGRSKPRWVESEAEELMLRSEWLLEEVADHLHQSAKYLADNPSPDAKLLASKVLDSIRSMEARIMLNLDRLAADVTRVEGVANSAIALIVGLAGEIRATPPTEAAIGDLADRLEKSADQMAAAIVAASQPATPAPGSVPQAANPTDAPAEGRPAVGDDTPPTPDATAQADDQA